jgi:hypothetical protein
MKESCELPFNCIECKAPAPWSLKCAKRDQRHAYLHLPMPANRNQGWADEIEGDQA